MVDIDIETLLMGLVAFFGEGSSALGQFHHFGIVVDIEVFRAEYFPVKAGVLDLVPPKVVELGRGSLKKQQEQERIFEDPDDHNRWNVEVSR